MNQVNIFERASREAFRFPSIKGEITVEQLWSLPLQSKTSFDLDNVAKTVNNQLKSMAEESFVNVTKNSAIDVQECKLEIVKHIIAVRLDENEKARQRSENSAKRAKLLEILERKQDAAMEGLTAEEIKAQIAALG